MLYLRQNSFSQQLEMEKSLVLQDIKYLENIDTDVSLKDVDMSNHSALIGQNVSCPNPDWLLQAVLYTLLVRIYSSVDMVTSSVSQARSNTH